MDTNMTIEHFPAASRFLALALAALLLAACGKEQRSSSAKDSTAAAADSGSLSVPRGLDRTASPIFLSYAMKTGESLTYSIENRERVRIARDTLIESNEQVVVYTYRFTVLGPGKNSALRMQALCVGIRFDGTYTSGGTKRNMSFHSDERNDEGKQKMFAQYNAPVNTPFEFLLEADGRVHTLTKLDPIIRRLMGKDYATTRLETKQELEHNYGENSLKNIVQLAFQRLEHSPVMVDSSWIVRWTGELGYFKLEHTARYTLKGLEAEQDGGLVAHIAATLTSRHLGEKKFDTGQGTATLEAFEVGGTGVSAIRTQGGSTVRRRLKQRVFVRMFVEIPEELKKAAPDQAKDFRMTQEASVENLVSRVLP